MSELIVTLAGLLMIMLIVWWFWLSKPRAVRADDSRPIEIVVKDGNYDPATISVTAGKPITLRFLRQDAASCAEKVVFGDLGITADLPLGHPQVVSLGIVPAGTHEFTCQMGMYRGRLEAQP